MDTKLNIQFTLHNYPKSHGSIDGWRLHEYLHLSEAEQEQVYKQLESFCLAHVGQSDARNEFNQYELIGSGWEWSVFAKNEHEVVKVPSGIFPEVNTPEYLTNAQKAYELLHRYYPSTMLANTTFARHNNINIIEQVRHAGQDNQLIHFNQAEKWLLQKLEVFFECTASLLKNEKWLPDFWLNHDPRGFILRNVMIDQTSNQFAIIDFTSYLDPTRMYPALCQSHCHLHSNKIDAMLTEVKKALDG